MSEYGPIHPRMAALANRLLGRPEDEPLTVADVFRAIELERQQNAAAKEPDA